MVFPHPPQKPKLQRALVLACGLLAALVTPFAGAQDFTPDRPDTVAEFMVMGGRARVVAHRGFSGRAPENTVAAVRAAIAAGADMAEIDVTLTADGHVVCLHDEKLGRTTDGRGRISEITLADALHLDAGSWFSRAFTGERIPTLGSVLAAARGQILLNIEVKPSAVDRGISRKVLQLVQDNDMDDQVVISSFSPAALARVRTLDPKISTVSLFNRRLHRGVDPAQIVGEVGSVALNINRRYLNRKIRERCREIGLPLGVYTANTRRKMTRLVAMEVHAVFTDHPDLLLGVVTSADDRDR